MKSKIFIFLGWVFFVAIKADNKDYNIKGHFEIIFEKEKLVKSIYLNLKTKSMFSCDIENLILVLIDGGSGNGLIVNMQSLKGWKLQKGWKANDNDLVKSAREYLAKIKSFKDLIDKNEEEIDLRKDKSKIEWYEKNILVNILNPWIKNPDIFILINLELQELSEAKDYALIYYNQNGKGVDVAIALTQIQIYNRLLNPILSDADIQKEQLKKANVNWKKIFGYSGQQTVGSLIYIKEIITGLKKELKDVHNGFVEEVSQTCSQLIKVKGGDKGSKEKGSDGKGSKEEGSKEKGSKEKGSKEKGSNEKGSNENGSNESD